MPSLTALAQRGGGSSDGWLHAFEAAALRVNRHLHRNTHELMPAARERLSQDQLHQAARTFIRTKARALRVGQRSTMGGLPSGEVGLIFTVCAVAAGLGYLAWQSRLFGRVGVAPGG